MSTSVSEAAPSGNTGSQPPMAVRFAFRNVPGVARGAFMHTASVAERKGSFLVVYPATVGHWRNNDEPEDLWHRQDGRSWRVPFGLALFNAFAHLRSSSKSRSGVPWLHQRFANARRVEDFTRQWGLLWDPRLAMNLLFLASPADTPPSPPILLVPVDELEREQERLMAAVQADFVKWQSLERRAKAAGPGLWVTHETEPRRVRIQYDRAGILHAAVHREADDAARYIIENGVGCSIVPSQGVVLYCRTAHKEWIVALAAKEGWGSDWDIGGGSFVSDTALDWFDVPDHCPTTRRSARKVIASAIEAALLPLLDPGLQEETGRLVPVPPTLRACLYESFLRQARGGYWYMWCAACGRRFLTRYKNALLCPDDKDEFGVTVRGCDRRRAWRNFYDTHRRRKCRR